MKRSGKPSSIHRSALKALAKTQLRTLVKTWVPILLQHGVSYQEIDKDILGRDGRSHGSISWGLTHRKR